MSLNWPKAHFGSSAEFQVSSWPFVTASNIATSNDIVNVKFPGVTRWICVHNNESAGASKTLKVGFTENGLNDGFHYLVHAGEQTQRWELNCTELFVGAEHADITFSVIAGYTNVPVSQFPVLTGSNGFVGVG